MFQSSDSEVRRGDYEKLRYDSKLRRALQRGGIRATRRTHAAGTSLLCAERVKVDMPSEYIETTAAKPYGISAQENDIA